MDVCLKRYSKIFETESVGLFKYKGLVNELSFCMCLFPFLSF